MSFVAGAAGLSAAGDAAGRAKAGAGAPTGRMPDSMPLARRSWMAASVTASRSGCTRVRVWAVMESSCG